MRNLDGRILLSTDLMRFMGCSHATKLDLEYMRGSGLVPREDSEDAALLQKRGNAHETTHLAKLKTAGRRIVEIARRDLISDAVSTKAALRTGTDVIFQRALLSGNWVVGQIFSNVSHHPQRLEISALRSQTPS